MDELSGLREALRFSPNNIKLRALIATKLMVEKRYEDAEEEYRLALIAVQNRPESSDAHVSLGYSLLYRGNARESFETFREALRLDPNNESVCNGLIDALKIHNIFYRLWFRFPIFAARCRWPLTIGLIVGLMLVPILVMVLFVLFCLVCTFRKITII